MVENIRRLCKQKNISVNDLEAATGLAKNTIIRWDSHSPSVLKVAVVADYFGVPIDALLPKK